MKAATKGITFVAALLLLGGVASYIKAENKSKPFALNIIFISATIGITNELTTAFLNNAPKPEIDALKDEIASSTKKYADLNEQYKKQSSVLTETKSINQSQAQEIESKQATIDALTQKVYVIQTEFKRKTEEINLKLAAEDTRLEEKLTEFREVLSKRISTRIHEAYNNLVDSIDSKFLVSLPDGTKPYEKLIEPLEKFKNYMQRSYDYSCSLFDQIKTLSTEELVTEGLTIYSQVYAEITSVKVRYRNTLNIEERRELENALETLSEYEKTTAIVKELKNAYISSTDAHKNDLHKFKSKVDENDHSLDEMWEKVNELLAQLKAEQIKVNQLNQTIEKLSEPIMWKFSLNHATKAGNLIIGWCQSKGIHLDRSHYTGDKYCADLFFFTDRLNAAQTIDIKALNQEGENLAQLTHCLEPIKFTYDYDSRLVVAHIVMLHREKDKPNKSTKDFIQPVEKLTQFVREAYHVGLWAETGGGKTTAISNVIGGMIRELGGIPTIKTTIPKIDADTAKIFPHVDWLGVPNSVFGLLEAALEIQYRIWLNEQAFLRGEEITDFEPMVFFIDEINMIFTRWGRVVEADLDDVLGRFAATREGERLNYFNQFMRMELENYKGELAKRLLLFIWQTGRSLRVKSLIAGQNLQPGSFRMMINDLTNCSYISFGDSIQTCLKYKVKERDKETISMQYEMLLKEQDTNPNLKFTALYCPSQGRAFYGILPPPGYYSWDADSLNGQVEIGKQSLSEKTDIQKAILKYLERSSSQSPKSWRQMRQNSKELRAWTESEIETACHELVERKELIYIENQGFYLPN